MMGQNCYVNKICNINLLIKGSAQIIIFFFYIIFKLKLYYLSYFQYFKQVYGSKILFA